MLIWRGALRPHEQEDAKEGNEMEKGWHHRRLHVSEESTNAESNDQSPTNRATFESCIIKNTA